MRNKDGRTPQPSASEGERRTRSVFREPEYERAIREIFKQVSQGESIVAGLEEFVRRCPEMGMAVKGLPAEFASWISKAFEGRRVRVIYHFDDEAVTLLEAWVIPDSDAFGRPH